MNSPVAKLHWRTFRKKYLKYQMEINKWLLVIYAPRFQNSEYIHYLLFNAMKLHKLWMAESRLKSRNLNFYIIQRSVHKFKCKAVHVPKVKKFRKMKFDCQITN